MVESLSMSGTEMLFFGGPGPWTNYEKTEPEILNMIIISRLRVVPLSVSPSRETREKTARKKWSRPQDFTRPFFFLAVYLRSRLTDYATEELLVV